MSRTAHWLTWIIALSAFASAAQGAQQDNAAQLVFQQTNAFRQEEKRAALSWNSQLAAVARDFAEYMARTRRYGHEAHGRQPMQRAEQHGYAYCIVDENIAYEQRSSPLAAAELASVFFEGWKHSPPHRHNMLDADVMDTGVGLAQNHTSGRWYAVQMFGRPASAHVTFEFTNAGAETLQYLVAGQRFQLAPSVTRTHEMCRAIELSVQWPGKQPTTIVRPANGERYTALQEPSGAWRLQRQ